MITDNPIKLDFMSRVSIILGEWVVAWCRTTNQNITAAATLS